MFISDPCLVETGAKAPAIRGARASDWGNKAGLIRLEGSARCAARPGPFGARGDRRRLEMGRAGGAAPHGPAALPPGYLEHKDEDQADSAPLSAWSISRAVSATP
ncbi:MAG: hypothetical protein Kow0013_21270 [Pararhodobacter sp.]